MKKAGAVALLISATVVVGGCGMTSGGGTDLDALGNSRQQQLVARLAKADQGGGKSTVVAKWIMPPELREISGLALTADGRVLTHDDETARISVIDPRRGMLLKTFLVGSGPPGDFESITVVGNQIYLLESTGILYQFHEGADGDEVPFSYYDLHTGKECEFESMVYQADSNRLVMPCKNSYRKAMSDSLVIYRWKLSGPESERLSMATIPLAQLVGANKWKKLQPSDITIDPATGNFVMIASQQKALVEFTSDGRVLRSEPLPPGHNQPEGVAITKDSILMISDEENKNPAAITLYRWHPAQKTDSIP